MNINDIKKGLECCLKPTVDYCVNCPYDNSKKYLDCDIDKMHQDALNLINELESENKEFVESCKNCHYIKDLEIANGHAQELKDRIAELEKENELLRNLRNDQS